MHCYKQMFTVIAMLHCPISFTLNKTALLISVVSPNPTQTIPVITQGNTNTHSSFQQLHSTYLHNYRAIRLIKYNLKVWKHLSTGFKKHTYLQVGQVQNYILSRGHNT